MAACAAQGEAAVSEPLELVADGFSFPTSLAFDDEGAIYVGESGLSFAGAPAGGRVWRIDATGARELVAEGFAAPLNGLTFHDGALFVSEASRITRLARDGTTTVLLDGLPGPGNYHTNMTVVGPDERLYFSQGAMTNTGIVGLDAYELGWLRQLPHATDIPGYDITLTGRNIETANPLSDDPNARARTGAFCPFGTPTTAGEQRKADIPATAAVMRCELDGSRLELVAWGLRNAFALGFAADGRLLAIDQGADDRGSRPVANAPDALYAVHEGAWYGWPDFIAARPITSPEFRPTRGPAPEFLLAHHADLPPPEPPLVEFDPHVAAVKFDTAPDGTLIVALFGDEAPMTAPDTGRAGRSLARVELPAANDPGRVETLDVAQLQRPIDVRFDTQGALYVLDFGRFEMTDHGVDADAASGKLWRLATPSPTFDATAQAKRTSDPAVQRPFLRPARPDADSAIERV